MYIYYNMNKCNNKVDTTKKKAEYQKKYRVENIDTLLEYEKDYRTEHKEERNEKHKQYYKDNKNKIAVQRSQKIICTCGGSYTPDHKTRHEQSAKHKKSLEK